MKSAVGILQIARMCVLGLLATSLTTRGQIVVTGETDGATLATALLGIEPAGLSNVTVTLVGHGTGDEASSGTFTVGGANGYGLDPVFPAGIVLSSGAAADYGSGSNLFELASTAFGVAATDEQNALLTPISGVETNFDVTELTLTFDAAETVSNLAVTVVFGSEEFPVFDQPDGFGIYLNGTNVGLIDGTVINALHPGITAVEETELNGATSAATIIIPITPGSTSNTLVFIIGDSNDTDGDSTVYLSHLTTEVSGVVTGVDLAVSVSGVTNVLIGSNASYTITVSNEGTDLATAVLLENTLATNATFVSVASSSGSCTQSNGVVTCELGDIGNDTNATVTVTLGLPVEGSYSNEVIVLANEVDVNPSNNVATVVLNAGSTLPPTTNVVNGAFQEVSVRCKENKKGVRCRVKGRFTLENTTDEKLEFAGVQFFLSDDTVLDANDIPGKPLKVKRLKPGITTKKFKFNCKECGDIQGKFIIAVIGQDENNTVVQGPLISE